MEVLSIMGGIVPGKLIGTAPGASYWLLRSEDTGSEYIVEEYNWVAAAEFADSVGADIINSSLGYTRFHDPVQDHTCADMDGNTTPVTRGANIAVTKGMIVVNSAGNSGGSDWHCVGSPADGNSVMAIAAVDSNGIIGSFSSRGEMDTRIKPNVAGMGVLTVLSAPDGVISRSNGTSFSSPVIAGMVACLWQAAPYWDNKSVFRAVELSGSQASAPDSLLGYGIPDFYKALTKLGLDNLTSSKNITVYPNPVQSGFTLSFHNSTPGVARVYILDRTGRTLESYDLESRAGENTFRLSLPASLASGYYLIKVITPAEIKVQKLIKL
jgi:hypothetical protein